MYFWIKRLGTQEFGIMHGRPSVLLINYGTPILCCKDFSCSNLPGCVAWLLSTPVTTFKGCPLDGLSPSRHCQDTTPYLVLTQWEPNFQQSTNSHLQNLPAHPFCKHTKWVIGHTNAYLHCNLAFVYTVMDFFMCKWEGHKCKMDVLK